MTQTLSNQPSNPVSAHTLLVQIIKNSKVNFVQMGAVLKYLQTGDKFKETTGGINTWEEYIRQPEIGLSVGESNRLIQIFEVFCEKFSYSIERIASVPVKNLHYLLPIAKDTDDSERVDRLLDDAEHLSQKDFRDRVFEEKEDKKRTFEYIIMERCIETGNMKRVYEIPEIEIIKLIKLYNQEINF